MRATFLLTFIFLKRFSNTTEIIYSFIHGELQRIGDRGIIYHLTQDKVMFQNVYLTKRGIELFPSEMPFPDIGVDVSIPSGNSQIDIGAVAAYLNYIIVWWQGKTQTMDSPGISLYKQNSEKIWELIDDKKDFSISERFQLSFHLLNSNKNGLFTFPSQNSLQTIIIDNISDKIVEINRNNIDCGGKFRSTSFEIPPIPDITFGCYVCNGHLGVFHTEKLNTIHEIVVPGVDNTFVSFAGSTFDLIITSKYPLGTTPSIQYFGVYKLNEISMKIEHKLDVLANSKTTGLYDCYTWISQIKNTEFFFAKFWQEEGGDINFYLHLFSITYSGKDIDISRVKTVDLFLESLGSVSQAGKLEGIRMRQNVAILGSQPTAIMYDIPEDIVTICTESQLSQNCIKCVDQGPTDCIFCKQPYILSSGACISPSPSPLHISASFSASSSTLSLLSSSPLKSKDYAKLIKLRFLQKRAFHAEWVLEHMILHVKFEFFENFEEEVLVLENARNVIEGLHGEIGDGEPDIRVQRVRFWGAQAVAGVKAAGKAAMIGSLGTGALLLFLDPAAIGAFFVSLAMMRYIRLINVELPSSTVTFLENFAINIQPIPLPLKINENKLLCEPDLKFKELNMSCSSWNNNIGFYGAFLAFLILGALLKLICLPLKNLGQKDPKTGILARSYIGKVGNSVYNHMDIKLYMSLIVANSLDFTVYFCLNILKADFTNKWITASLLFTSLVALVLIIIYAILYRCVNSNSVSIREKLSFISNAMETGKSSIYKNNYYFIKISKNYILGLILCFLMFNGTVQISALLLAETINFIFFGVYFPTKDRLKRICEFINELTFTLTLAILLIYSFLQSMPEKLKFTYIGIPIFCLLITNILTQIVFHILKSRSLICKLLKKKAIVAPTESWESDAGPIAKTQETSTRFKVVFWNHLDQK